jgi:predicted amidohydrolase
MALAPLAMALGIEEIAPLLIAGGAVVMTFVSALSSASTPQIEARAEDPAIEQIYRRYKVHDYRRQTNWRGLEEELERYIFKGDPVLHVDSTREYPLSVDECEAHKYPMDVQQVLSIVYYNPHTKRQEPHAACPYCGIIMTMPNAR